MKDVIEKLISELDELTTSAAYYTEWIKQAKEEKNDYGVECYSEDLREVAKLITQYKQAIGILRKLPQPSQPSLTEQPEKRKPWPFNGYAPGNYMNDCAVCKKTTYNVDKLCFVCLECAVIGAQQILDQYSAAPQPSQSDALDFTEMDKVIRCLAIELPGPVWEDVNKRWQAFKSQS